MEVQERSKTKAELETEINDKKLWCPKCQRGITGDNITDQRSYKSGDACPICLQKSETARTLARRRGYDEPNLEIGTLWTIGDWKAEIKRIGDIEIEKAMRNSPKGIKSPEQALRESEDRLKDEIQSLKDQIALMAVRPAETPKKEVKPEVTPKSKGVKNAS